MKRRRECWVDWQRFQDNESDMFQNNDTRQTHGAAFKIQVIGFLSCGRHAKILLASLVRLKAPIQGQKQSSERATWPAFWIFFAIYMTAMKRRRECWVDWQRFQDNESDMFQNNDTRQTHGAAFKIQVVGFLSCWRHAKNEAESSVFFQMGLDAPLGASNMAREVVGF